MTPATKKTSLTLAIAQAALFPFGVSNIVFPLFFKHYAAIGFEFAMFTTSAVGINPA